MYNTSSVDENNFMSLPIYIFLMSFSSLIASDISEHYIRKEWESMRMLPVFLHSDKELLTTNDC